MTRLVVNELRLLWPSFIVSMSLTVVAALADPDSSGLFLFILFVGAALIALAPFGREYSLGTLSTLLSQPISRRRLWSIKVGLSFAAMAFQALFFVLIAGAPAGFLNMILLIVLVALAGGLWTTIVFRQIGASFVFTIVAPYLIVLVWAMWHAIRNSYVYSSEWAPAAALIIYSVTTIVWSRHRFLSVKDADVLGRKIALPSWRIGFRRRVRAHTRPRRALPALFWKEVATHQMAFFIAGGLLILHLASLATRERLMLWGTDAGGVFVSRYGTGSVFETAPILLWLVLPWIAGATAVADERKQGTLISQLCLPISRRRQFAVKLMVALVTGLVLGCLAPLGLEGLGYRWLDAPHPQFMEYLEGVDLLLPWSLAAASVTLLAFFASSLSRTAFEALVVSLVGAPLLVFPNTLFVALLKVGPSISFGPFVLIFLSATVAASLMLVLLSFVNYQAPAVSIRLWIRSIVAIVLAACLAGTAGAAVFHRPWERFMSLEPPHGPPALSGATRPKLCGLSGSLFVLLPDGRIWTARMFDGTAPVSGEFLESTWKDLACVNARFLGDIERPLAAVRVDGSLWQFQVHRSANRDQPVVVVGSRRVGEGNDWTSVFDVRSCFVGKKSDRSLWGWGTHRGPAGDMEPCALPIDRTLTEEPQPIFPGAIESWDRDVRSPVSVDRGAITVEPCAQMVGYVFCRQELEERGFFSPRPSAYSDWLQASLSRAEIGFVALAADGTICSWDNLWRVNPGLLRQSARPQWCFNILTGAR